MYDAGKSKKKHGTGGIAVCCIFVQLLRLLRCRSYLVTSKCGAPMALITDMRDIAESLENRGQYANASVVTKAVEVLKKQQVLLQSQEEDITEMKIPRGVRKWRDRGLDRRCL